MSFVFGPFALDQERRQLLRSGEPVPLEAKAFELLSLLLARRPRVLSKAEIRDVLWPGISVGETSLPRLVTALRQALGDEVQRPRFIRTAHGFGYAFCGEARDDAESQPKEAPALAPGQDRPYPGLSAFTEADAEQFFGREAEVAALWEKMGRQKLLALIGPSGVGKTSFLRAGVIPRAPANWVTAYLTPGESPAAALAGALTPALASEPESLAELIQGAIELVQTGANERVVSAVSRWKQRTSEALLFFDQFEELYTLNPEETQQRFAMLLGRLTEEAGVHVLLSLRDDFLFRCHAFPSLAPVFRDVTPLGPPSAFALRRALVEPAARHGVRFEDEALVDEMVMAVAKERGALPLLAFAVSRLWDERDRESKLMTRTAYVRIRGVEGALAEQAEATLREIGPEREKVVREIFRNLATAEGTRGAREREELLSVFADSGPDREEAEAILDVLVGARLLTEYDDPDGPEGRGRSRIEIVHESLLTHWPRLERWRAQDEEGALLRDQLRQAARLWDEKGRPEELLWTGQAYREYVAWRGRYEGGLSTLEEGFAQGMIALAGRRRRRRRIAFVTLLAAAVAVALVTSSLWRRSETSRQKAEAETQIAEASKLLALAQRELATYPTAALAYVLKSLELADTEVGRVFALRVLQHAPTMILAPAGPEQSPEAFSAAFSPNGEWLGLGGTSKVQLFHQDGRSPRLLGHYGGVDKSIWVGFRPKSDLLVANRGGDVRVWSIPDGRELRRGAFEEGPPRLWVREDGFLTSAIVGPRLVFRSWPFGDGEPRLLGSLEATEVSDAASRWLAYAHGRKIFLRSLDHWASPPRLLAEHPAEAANLSDMTFSPDGERLAVVDVSGEIRIWSAAERSARPLRILQAKQMNPNTLAFDANGTKLAVIGAERGLLTARVWDLAAPPAAEPLLIQRTDSSSLGSWKLGRFDPSGRWFVLPNIEDMSFWALSESRPHVIAQHLADVTGLVFAGDGKWLVSRSDDKTVVAWPLSPGTGAERRIRAGYENNGGSVAVDPTSTRVVVTGVGRVRLVSLDGGPTRELEGFSSETYIHGLAFGDGGRLVAAAVGPPARVRVWNLETGAVQDFWPPPVVLEQGPVRVYNPRFLGRDFLLVSSLYWVRKEGTPDPGLLRVDLRSGTVLVLGPAPNRAFVISRGEDFGVGVYMSAPPSERTGLVRFSVADGRSTPLAASGSHPISVALDPTDSLVATGDSDGTVRIGRLTGGEPHLLLGHEGNVWAVAFSPDGRWLASGGADRTIRLWPVPDLAKTPLHKRPHWEFLDVLRSHTNMRAVPDPQSPTGWKLEAGPFPGWAKLPEW